VTTRFIIAGLLIALLAGEAAAVIAWAIYHSRARTDARRSARRRTAEAAHLALLREAGSDG
jgi:hypothetical protein